MELSTFSTIRHSTIVICLRNMKLRIHYLGAIPQSPYLSSIEHLLDEVKIIIWPLDLQSSDLALLKSIIDQA